MSLPNSSTHSPTGYYRWVVCGLLFFATTINYIDRQILSLIKEILDEEIGWTNEQFGWVNSAFQLAYGFGLVGAGWFVDRFGTKIGYALSITPPFPRLRSDPMALSEASRRKQSPCSVNPLFPASGPTQWLFQRPPAQSNLLAAVVCLALLSQFLPAAEVKQILPFTEVKVESGQGSIQIQTENTLAVSYDSNPENTVRVMWANKIKLDTKLQRIFFFYNPSDGNCEVRPILCDRDGTEIILSVRSYRENCGADALSEWSSWRTGETVNLSLPTESEITMRTIPEYEAKVRALMPKKPLWFIGLAIYPKPVEPILLASRNLKKKLHATYRRLYAPSTQTTRSPMRNTVYVTDLVADLQDSDSAAYAFSAQRRLRYGRNMPFYVFPDDMALLPGNKRYEITLQQSYQGSVVWQRQGTLAFDPNNPLQCFADRLPLPTLPRGRYFVMTKVWEENKPNLEATREFDIIVSRGPEISLEAVSAPFSLSTGMSQNVFPHTERNPSITVMLTDAKLRSLPTETKAHVRVKSWRNETIFEQSLPVEKKFSFAVSQVTPGCDYIAEVTLVFGTNNVESNWIHFGIQNLPVDLMAKTPVLFPKRENEFVGRAEILAENRTTETELFPPFRATYEMSNWEAWVKQTASMGYRYTTIDVVWTYLEVLPGVIRTSMLEEMIAIAKKYQLRCLFSYTWLVNPKEFTPYWLTPVMFETQFGEINFDHLSAHDTASKKRMCDFYRYLAWYFRDEPSLVGHRLEPAFFRSGDLKDNQVIWSDYSPPAQSAFVAWEKAKGGTLQTIPRPFVFLSFRPDEFGPDLSQGWLDFMQFNVSSRMHSAEKLVKAIRDVDETRPIFLYRKKVDYASESWAPLCRQYGVIINDEGGPGLRQVVLAALCRLEGTSYYGELLNHATYTKAIADAQFYYESLFSTGQLWVNRFILKDSMGTHPAKNYQRRPELTTVAQTLPYAAASMSRFSEFMQAGLPRAQVLVFGSRASAFCLEQKRSSFFELGGAGEFGALLEYHDVRTDLADEYTPTVNLDNYKVVFVGGEAHLRESYEKIVAYAKKGGKIVLVDAAGKYSFENPNARGFLAEQLKGCGNIKKIARQSVPPAPGEQPNAGRAFNVKELEDLLGWAGVQRDSWCDTPGFVTSRRSAPDRKTYYLAVMRRWKGSMTCLEIESEAIETYGLQACTANVRLPSGKYSVEQFHRTDKNLGTRKCDGTLSFQIEPMAAGEVRLYRIREL